MRKLVTFAVVVAVVYAVVAYVRRRATPPEHVELFYDDGSHVTLADADAQPFVDAATSALAADS